MTPNSLIPDRQLTFSPDLAATIGLHEAILLQTLGPKLTREGVSWITVDLNELSTTFPFWSVAQLKELLGRLEALGIISCAEGVAAHLLRLSLQASSSATPAAPAVASMPATVAAPQPAETVTAAPAPNQRRPVGCASGQSSTSVSPAESGTNWKPSQAILEMLSLNHGVSHEFALNQLTSFVAGPDDHARPTRFRQHVLSAWRRYQHQHPVFISKPPKAFDNQWQPSADAMEIMTRAGIDPEFVDSVRHEFILYWREKGGAPQEVNSKFIAYVRQRWARYSAGLSHSTEPTRIPRGWHPDEQVYDILAMAGIPRDYAVAKLPEFVLYWLDTNELHTSWNSKFLQHIKYQWRREQQAGTGHDKEQVSSGYRATARTRDRSLEQDLSDTSWAD